MMWVLIIVGGFIGFVVWECVRDDKADEETNNYFIEKYKKMGKKYIKGYPFIKYVGGFKDISSSEVSLAVLDSELEIKFENKNITRYIKKEDINDIYVSNKTEIQNNVSMGKILAFGALSLGMDNTKEETKGYIIVNCNYEGDNLTLIFTGFVGEIVDDKVQLMRKVYLGK